MAPTVLFEGASVFDAVRTALHARDIPTAIAPLISTGTLSPHNPSMHDDEEVIAEVLRRLVEDEGSEVVLVVHSAGGFLSAAAMEGLDRLTQEAKGKRRECCEDGGLSGGLKGDGSRWFVDPENTLFGDLNEEETGKWIGVLKSQPAEGWDDGWKHVPSVYLVGEGDKIIPPQLQLAMADVAGSEIVKCEAGHMAMLSAPEKVVQVIFGAVKSVS